MEKNNPFFNVCIETNNRSATIKRSLISIQNQSFRDFEVVIVDNCSTDNTYYIIKNFFESELFLSNPFHYILKNNQTRLSNKLENWNRPLHYATGKYIAMLEGDDIFLPNHLMIAYDVLSNNENIGLYSASTTRRQRPWSGIKKSKPFLIEQFTMKQTPPPSEMIFIRSHNGKAFRYNTKDYIYAPEIDLYLQIANFGYDTFFNSERTIERDIEGIPKPIKWQSTHDRFTIIKLWGYHLDLFNNKLIKETWDNTCKLAFWRYLSLKMARLPQAEDIWSDLKRETKSMNYFIYLKYLFKKRIAIFFISIRFINIFIKFKRRMVSTNG